MQDIGVKYLPRVRRMVGGRAPGILIRDFVSSNVIPVKRFSEWVYHILHVQTAMENGDFGLSRQHQMLIVLVRSTRPSQLFFSSVTLNPILLRFLNNKNMQDQYGEQYQIWVFFIFSTL